MGKLLDAWLDAVMPSCQPDVADRAVKLIESMLSTLADESPRDESASPVRSDKTQ